MAASDTRATPDDQYDPAKDAAAFDFSQSPRKRVERLLSSGELSDLLSSGELSDYFRQAS
jgi:hypothetical protein